VLGRLGLELSRRRDIRNICQMYIKDILLAGFLFTLTVYVMYILYGAGILTALYSSGLGGVLMLILNVLLIIMIVAELYAYFSYKPGFRSMEMPMRLRPIAKSFLSKVENPLMAVPVAALCSVLLLPCSSGPYVVALIRMYSHGLGIISPLLLYYNLVFVLPMIAITLVVAFGTSPKKVLEWKEKHIRNLHLIAGLLLIGVLIYVNLPSGEASVGNPFSTTKLYLLYSHVCPHCAHLKEYLRDFKNVSVTTLCTDCMGSEEKVKKVVEELKKRNFTWDGGVPLLFCILKNETVVAVEGFPTVTQDNNGFYYSKSYEENELCIKKWGEPVRDENGNYLFCRVSENLYIGNYNSVKRIISICSTYGTVSIEELE
jgi:glutaredoxin-related protein